MTEVAMRTGYRDPLYFAKVFKKAKGITPSEYQCLHL
ncbi:MAG: AraC family transcriptional regulator [Oscillospiraceae bacterium]